MGKFDHLIELIDKLDNDDFGTWHVEKHKGTADDPIRFPYPDYNETVDTFIHEIYVFADNNPDYDLYNYNKLLQKRKIKKIEDVDFDNIDAKGVMALLMCFVRGERFCDGLIFDELEKGNIQKLLKRLREICERE